MQQRDTTKPDQAQGLYERYRVERIDGQADADGTRYFVLRTTNLTNDQPETAALRAFAGSVETTHPQLAADLRALLPDSSFPLAERMKGTIVALRANYSKSAAQAALADLEAALPLIAAQTEPGEMQHIDREQALVDLESVLARAPHSGFTCPEDVYSDLRVAAEAGASGLRERDALITALAAWRAGALELIESRLLAASKPNVRDALRAAVRGEEDLACFWGAAREALQTRTRTLPPDLVTRAAAVATALDENYAENTMAGDGTGPTISDTAVTVLREIIAAVESSSGSTLETRFVGVHYTIGGANEPRTVFRFEGLPDVSVPDADADKLVARHIGQSGLKNKVAAAICNNSNYPPAAQVHILGRNLTRLIDAVFGALGVVPVTVGDDPGVGRGDETVVTVVDQETGERVEWREGDRCTINGEGSTVFTLRELRANVAMPVDPSGQPNGWKSYEQMHKVTADPLAERARGAAGALRKLGLGEPASSVVADAADVLSEAGEALRGEAINLYWLVDEYNDTEGETFGIAVRASRDVDRALFKWARSYEAMLATERGETPQAAVLNRRLANGGDALTFRRGLTSAELEAIENASDNGYSARVRILSAEGTKVLLDAINDTPPGGSLSLYKGTLSTCMPELEDAEQPVPEPTELADLVHLLFSRDLRG